MMAGKGDVTTATDEARKPAGGTGAFDGGIATKDVEPVWQTEALPGWVVHHLVPLLTAGQSWPEGSESKLWELRVEYVKLMNLLISTLDPTSATVQTLNGSLQSPAKPAIFKRLAKLYDDKAGVVAKAQESFSYAKMVDNFARETQYTKLSINVAFWIAVIAAFIALIAAGFFPLASLMLRSVGAAGGSRIALIMERLALVAARSGPVAASGQISKLAGAGAGRFFNAALAAELFEEISEELVIDLTTQYQQIRMGTRDSLDWKKVKAAAIGAGAGAIAGTKLGDPMSRFANDLPGISRLNRIAGDNRGVGNAFLRFPGRALNTGLNNMVASPAGSIVANYAVYDQFALPGAEGFYGGFLGGAGRTNTLSPTNLEVLHAAVTPVTSLSGVFNEAMAAQRNASTITTAPGLGDLSSVPGPQTGSPDAGGSPVLPQGDLSGGGRRDRTSTVTEPAAPQQPAPKAARAVQTPDAPQAPRPQHTDDAKPRQDSPTPQVQSQPQDQQDQQDRSQDPPPDARPASQPVAQDASPADQQAAPTTDQAPAETPHTSPGSDTAASQTPATTPVTTTTPDTTPAPDTAPAPDTTTTPDTTPAPDRTSGTSDTSGAPAENTTQDSTGTPETARTGGPQSVGEPRTAEPAPAPQDTGTLTTAETAAAPGPTPQNQADPTPVPAPAQQSATPGPSLVTRLIGAVRRTRDAHALVSGRPVKRTRFVANGRASGVPALTVAEARAAFEVEVLASDLGPEVTGMRWTAADTLVVEVAGLPDQRFTFTVGRVTRSRLGRTVLYANGENRVRLAPGVAPDQVARLVLHEIADTLHARNQPRQGLMRRLITQPNERDECLTARRRELVFLTRRIGETSGIERSVMEAERDAVRRILEAHGELEGGEARPAPARQSTNDLIDLLIRHDQAVAQLEQDLDQVLAQQIDRLLRVESDLRLLAMTVTDMGTSSLLTAASQARAAYESAQSLVHTASAPGRKGTEFARALHAAHQLRLRYEEQADPAVFVPALPQAAEPDVLGAHIAALRAAADELTSPAGRSPGTAAERRSAADSAVRAAETYQLLLDETVQARRILIAPPHELASQLLRLGATHEGYYRKLTTPDLLTNTRDAQAIDATLGDLLQRVSDRRAAATALRTTIEGFDGVVRAQRAAVRAYNQAASTPYVLAAEALAARDLEGARRWRAIAAELARLGALHEAAEGLAIAARDAHEVLADLLKGVASGEPVDHAALNAAARAAATAMEAYQDAVAALPPATPPALSVPEPPPTALSELRAEVEAEERRLEAAWAHNLELSSRHRHHAEESWDKAREAWNHAFLHGLDEDDGAPERARRQVLAAEQAESAARYHTRAAERYAAAAIAANQALDATDATLTALNRVNRPDKPRTLQVEVALQEMRSRSDAYDSAHREALPPPHALLAAYTAGPIANLARLTDLVNKLLTDQGLSARFSQEELRRAIRQAFQTAVAPDGLLLRLNGIAGAELRIRLTLDDLMEVVKPAASHSETMLGQLPQGGGRASATGRRSRGLTFDRDIMDLGRHWMRSTSSHTLHRIADHGVMRFKWSRGGAHSVSTSAQDNGLGGNVEDNRGTATMFTARASWSVELRTASGTPVTASPPAGKTTRQSLWLSHAYLLDPSDQPLQLPEADRRRSPFPEHVVVSLTGLLDLAERVTGQLPKVMRSPVARGQVVTAITEDLPGNLGTAVNDPAGLRRTIIVNGRIHGVMTMRTTVLPGDTRVGGPSTKHHQERLRVGSSHAGQSHSDSHDADLGGAVGWTSQTADQTGQHHPAWEATLRGDVDRAASASSGVTGVAIHPSVHRWAGETQGYLLNMVHTVTIQMDGQAPITLVSDPSTGLFRIPEPDAYRYGLPVDPAAEIGRDADGNVVLRGDPAKVDPPGRVGALPTWYGTGENQTRGAGPALVQRITGMDSVREQVEKYLRREGVLPKLRNGVPHYSLDASVRASQMANEQLVAEQFSAERLETGYDQAAQAGLIVNLVHHSPLGPAEHYTLRISLRQDFGNAVYEGVTGAEPVVNLDIGSDTYTSSRNLTGSWGAGLGSGLSLKDDPGLDLGGSNLSAGLGRNRQVELTTGSTVNQVKLLEGTGQSAVFRIPHVVQVERLTGANLVRTVAEGRAGDARIVLPSDLLPLALSSDGHPRPPGPRHRTSTSVLRRATVAHLDVGDIATTVADLLGGSLDRGSPAFQHLAAFFNVRSLVSHPEVFTTGHRTGVDRQTAKGTARHQPVSLRLTQGQSRFLSATDILVGDINLTLSSQSSTTRISRPRDVEGSMGVPAPGERAEEGSGTTSWGRTTSNERKLISGPERLTIDTGRHYAFVMDVAAEVTVGSGIGAKTVTRNDGTAVYLVAERDALDLYANEEVELPLHQLADAAERVMNGDLKLGRRVAVRFITRYLQDLESARTAHPSGVPGLTTLPGVPLSRGHDTGRALAALLELFSSETLAEMMPPGVPPGRPGETDAETIDRMLSRPEFHHHVQAQLEAAARRLENGDVAAVLAPPYQDAIGMSTVKGVSLHPEDRPGAEVELLEEIKEAVEAVAPGALAQDTELWRALSADFSGNSWLGKIDTLLDPDSPPAEYTVRGDGLTDTLEVTVRAVLGDDVQYRGEVSDVGQILQLYTMHEENVSESSALTGTFGGKDTEDDMESGSVGTDRGRGASAASNLQETRVQRAASFEGTRAEVRQGIRLVVDVRRVRSTSPVADASPVAEASRRVSGTIDRLVPPGMVARAGTAPQPAVADPRPFPVPENFMVESTRVKDLAKAVERHLKATVGRDLSVRESRALARILTGSNRNVNFELMTAEDGLMVLEVPLAHRRVARVHVGAVLSEPVTIAQGHKDFEIGQVDRRQWGTSASADRTRWFPAGFSGGSKDIGRWLPFGLKFGMGGSYRSQGVDGASVGGGNRRETSVFEKADSSSVRFRVDYTVRVEVSPAQRSGQRPPQGAVRVATGHADVIVFDEVMRELAGQAENPPPVAGHEAPGPVAPAAAALPGPVGSGTGRPVRSYGELRRAQVDARDRNETVLVTLRPPYGPPLTYVATPDGRLTAQGDDGGFGRRFAGLPSSLIAVAEQHGMDLLALHERTMPRTDTNPAASVDPVDPADPAGRPERQAEADQAPSLAGHLRNELSRRGIMPAADPAAWPAKNKPDDAENGPGGAPRHTHASPLNSAFVADGRPADEGDLTVDEARQAFNNELLLEDFGGAAGAWRVIWDGGDTLVLDSALLGQVHFKFQVGPVEGGYLGETTATNTGERGDPHLVTLAPRVASDQVARLVLHEISDVLQFRTAGEHTHPHTPGEATRDECVTARRNELRFLERKQREALAAGDTAAADRLAVEIAAVEADLAARTGPPHPIDALINWTEETDTQEASDIRTALEPEAQGIPGDPELAALGVRGEPEPLGANVSKVMLADGSPALLLEESTPKRRNLTLLMTQLAHRLGLVGPARAAGDRHILIDWTPTATSGAFLGTREAVLSGYLAALADITPLVTRPALHVLPSTRPLLDLFLREDASGRRDWASNPLSPSDVRVLGAMLEAAREDFARMGLQSHYDEIVRRHQGLAGGPFAGNAVGLESVVAAVPGAELPLARVAPLSAMDESPSASLTGLGPVAEGRAINAARRLRLNVEQTVKQGVPSKRASALGDVVTFADGSRALRIPLSDAPEVLVRALARQALGLAGPALHLDEDGYVWRTFGSDALRASVATGVSRVLDVPGSHGRTTEVVFGDGRRALRHEFPTRAAADEHEARLEEAYEAGDGLPGAHRATPYVLYEELRRPAEPTPETQARLATRALYTFLAHGEPLDHATLRRLLDVNPLLVLFGEAGDWEFRGGAPVLAPGDVARVTAAFEALRDTFGALSLGDRYERLLNMLSEFTGSDDARLIPLAFSEDRTTVEYRAPAWRPAPGTGPVLGDLLRNDHLARVIAENRTDVISRADAELAARASAEGHVFARLPAGLVPRGILAGEEFTVDTLIDGVDDAGHLAEGPHGTRVTILASDYVPVADVSGKPHHALFRSGARFTVTAVMTADNGEVHYFLKQHRAQERTGPVVTPRIGLTDELARDIAHHLQRNAVTPTAAGLRIRSGLDVGAAKRHTVRPVEGAFVVEGHYSRRGMIVDDRLLRAEVVAAMLLCSPDLPQDAAIILAGPHDGTTAFAQELAWYTGRVVLAADGAVETTSLGNLRVGNAAQPSAQFRFFLPGDTSAVVGEQLMAWLGPELAAMPEDPRASRTVRKGHVRPVPLLAAVRPVESSGPVSAPPLSARHRDLISEHRREVNAGIWYRDESTAVMPTADPRLLQRSNDIIDVAIAGDGTGFFIGSERLSAADLGTMLAHDPRVLAQPDAWIRILGCETARDPAVLQELADLTGRSILAGNEIVYIGADRQAHTATVQGYDADGRPVFPFNDDGQWLQAHPSRRVTPATPFAVPAPPPVLEQRRLPQSAVDEALAADPHEWEMFGEQGEDGTVEHLTLRDGTKIVRKWTGIPEAKAEILGSLVGRLIGATVPIVVAHPTDPRTVFMEYIHGTHPAVGRTDTRAKRNAILLELLDLLILNNDRHLNNLYDTGSGLAGVDTGRAFIVPRVDPARAALVTGTDTSSVPAVGKTLRGNFVATGPGNRSVWVDNPLSRQDVDFLTDVMVSLAPHYRDSDFIPAYEEALKRLYHIGMHAKGEISLLAPPAPAPARVQSHFGWDFDDHNEVVEDVTRRLADGEDVASVVPYMTRDAMTTDVAFGLELEFAHAGETMDVRADDVRLMAAELHRAGLAASPEVFGHHKAPDSMSGRPYMEREANPRLIAGEFVSGILRDTERTWAELARITEIIKSHGGEITPATGGHIHVGAPGLGTDVRAMHRLLTLYYGYEDILFRLGQDPREPFGMHRPYRQCEPNEVTGGTERSTEELREVHRRPSALNLAHVIGTADDHVEFRHNDGHLDPSFIQARIKLVAAIVDYARNGEEHLPAREQLGTHLEHDRDPRRDAASFIEMVNTLFPRQADKEQLTALFAITTWQPASDDGRW
ncbi:WXG100-like domain-containing protein [Nonomuraea sp. NPDC001699]